ncbi:Prophage Lp2 protein 6 [Actinosynnema pretiosum subsp. pretiosum]|nr:Prophage Lp2 protein 6 [Actinosynnema pretiosum subsp. pretiosum]
MSGLNGCPLGLNRRPIARLWFNRSKKYLGVFDEQKVETRVAIERVEDIYLHAEQLRLTVNRYLGAPAEPPAA